MVLFTFPELELTATENREKTKPHSLFGEDRDEVMERLEELTTALSDEGNEAKIFTSFTDKFDLSIIGHNQSTAWQLKKTTEFITQNSSSSVLYMPI